jgi:ParB family chromosome partitioning protein
VRRIVSQSRSCSQKTIQAAEYFTRSDNGLSKNWHGRVWLNPPYSQPDIQKFIEKLVGELNANRATEAILLTHNYTDTSWFHHAESAAAAICFTRGRIKFLDANDEACAPTQGQAFFYYGNNTDGFRSVFNELGFIR